MADRTAALSSHKAQANPRAFYQQLEHIAPGLRNYIRQRLLSAERRRLIPPGLYAPEDVLDDVLLHVYEHFDAMPTNEEALRIKLFQLANERLDELLQDEAWHRNAVSLEELLSDELKLMDEIPLITVDADGDILLVEELDDAELAPQEPKLVLLEDSFEEELMATLGLDRRLVKADKGQRAILAHLYDRLPEQSRILLDLWTRGKLSIDEIAKVRALSVEQVQTILQRIRTEFQQRLQ